MCTTQKVRCFKSQCLGEGKWLASLWTLPTYDEWVSQILLNYILWLEQTHENKSLFLVFRSDSTSTIELQTHVACLLFYAPWLKEVTISLQWTHKQKHFMFPWWLSAKKGDADVPDLIASSVNREASTPVLMESFLWEVGELYLWPAHPKVLFITFPSDDRGFWVNLWKCVKKNHMGRRI